MQPLPRHWAVHRDHVEIPGRGELDLAVSGWSVDSPAEAERHARERWRALVERGGPGPRRGQGPAGEYYPRRHLPEPILEEITGPAGVLAAAVTRNRYGAEVLNTDAVLVCDIDFPPGTVPRSPRRGLLGRLFGGGGSSADTEEHARGLPGEGSAREAHEEILERIGRFCTAHPELGTRAYRTRNGFRLLVTGSGLAPTSAGARALMEELGTDPLYTRLCRVHECYRARLTPKPWRVGVPTPPPVRPWSAEATWFPGWLRSYREASTEVAVCRLLGVHGPAPEGIERELVERHDRAVRAGSGLPLA